MHTPSAFNELFVKFKLGHRRKTSLVPVIAYHVVQYTLRLVIPKYLIGLVHGEKR